MDLKNQQKLKGIILDLRSNPGGLLNESIDIVNLFDRSIIICGRLASAVVKMEKKFDTVKETVDYIYSNADKHIQERNKIITLLTQRLKKKGGLD